MLESALVKTFPVPLSKDHILYKHRLLWNFHVLKQELMWVQICFCNVDASNRYLLTPQFIPSGDQKRTVCQILRTSLIDVCKHGISLASVSSWHHRFNDGGSRQISVHTL